MSSGNAYSDDQARDAVDLLSRAILGRPAEGEGWTDHARALQDGRVSEVQMATDFMTSPEFHGRGVLQALSEPLHDPILLQTADPVRYREMLEVTSRTVRAYCARHSLRYESYLGIKRGYWPWHAAYNRLFMLRELMDRGFRGWAVHIDADAFIVDQQFDLRAYLADKQHAAAIGVLVFGSTDATIPGNGPHNINSGVMLFNLGHPVGREIVVEWHRRYMAIPEYIVRQADVFDAGMPSDQELLYYLLQSNEIYTRHIHFESAALINSGHASFIRQHLRAMHVDFEMRMRAIEAEVSQALARHAGGNGPA